MLILACDGLWDVLTNSSAAHFVRRLYLKGETDMQLIAEELIETAFHRGV